MSLTCPNCRAEVPAKDVDARDDTVSCRTCGELFRPSEQVHGLKTGRIDLSKPPKGAWFIQDAHGFEAGASTRHFGAFVMVPFMLVFSAAFVAVAALTHGDNTAMLWVGRVAAIPFILVTLYGDVVALLMACGKVVVRVRDNEGTVFTGVGKLGWTRRFRWDQTRTIEERLELYDGEVTSDILIHVDRTLRVGLIGFNDERHFFLLAALRKMFRERSPAGVIAPVP